MEYKFFFCSDIIHKKMLKIVRKECNIITENRGIIELLNVLSRYYSGRKAKNSRKKLLRIVLEKIAKIFQKMT